METLLKLKEIRKNYRLGPIDVEVLRGLSLSVHKGELLAIVGQSGCGKSTLMNILGLLDKPTSGDYIIDGKEIDNVNDWELSDMRNRKIGFVFQSYYLLAKLSALENVGIPLLYRGTSPSEIKERSRDMLSRVGMLDREHHKPNELSGGQQQRVAIARALVGTPSLILADEPSGALDSQTSREILNLFIELNRDDGITIVVITHDPKLAAQCKRQIKMVDGLLYEE